MKKTFSVFFAILIFTGAAFSAEYTKFSRKFIKHIKDCDKYEETITSEYEDTTFKTERKIHGWKNGLCKYTETITSAQGAYKLDCGFNEVQLDDLYEAMRDRSKKAEKYTLDTYTEQTNPKTGAIEYIKSGSTEIKGNKAYIIWAKYQNNPYLCRPTEIIVNARDIGKDK